MQDRHAECRARRAGDPPHRLASAWRHALCRGPRSGQPPVVVERKAAGSDVSLARSGRPYVDGGATVVPDGGHRLLLVEPRPGREYLAELLFAQRLADLGHQLGLAAP